jgi:hypothetical protein
MPTSVAILTWGAAITAVALAALIDGLGRAPRLRRQRALGPGTDQDLPSRARCAASA